VGIDERLLMRRFGGVVLAFGALLVLSGCSGKTSGTTGITDSSATLHATGRCDSGETCMWYWEYWPANQPRSTSTKTPVRGPVTGPTGSVKLSTNITGLAFSTAYRWVFCASPNNGGAYACAGPHGTFGSTTADPPPDYATFTTTPRRTLAERWDGTAWTIRATPNPSGAQRSVLSAVSCASATACTAVGSYTNSAGTQLTLAERWNGTGWTIQPTPNPIGSTGSGLSDVSCTSATTCTAVGSGSGGTSTSVTLAERWAGTTWTIQTTPNPTPGSELSGVSCTSATACTAVGFGQNGTLAERWDGTTWTIQPTPNQPGALFSSLSDASCVSAAACTAVGHYNGFGHSAFPLAERWDGTTWAIQTTPSVGQASALSEVSCTSAAACTAVGSANNNTTLAERWDGTSWTIQSTPNPAGAQFPDLSGVSCTSTTACTAVGSYVGSAGTLLTLAEAWGGTTWAIQPTPNPTGAPALSGVACTSATACTAVGSY
jgi:hypothetical protein